MCKFLGILICGIFAISLNATELKIDANGDGNIDTVSYYPIKGQGEPLLKVNIKTKVKTYSFMYYYSTNTAKIESCGPGCLIGIQVQGGNYGLDLKEYFQYDRKRTNWFLTKRVELVPREIKKNGSIISIQRDEKDTIYDESLTIDYIISPKYSLQEFVSAVKTMDIALKNSLSKEYVSYYLEKFPLSSKNLTTYNNIAYYLQKASANKEAIYLLEKILKKYPNRTVAYYNLGDAYWAIGEKEKAKQAYRTYIKQMKAKGKEKKIPKTVLQRVH